MLQKFGQSRLPAPRRKVDVGDDPTALARSGMTPVGVNPCLLQTAECDVGSTVDRQPVDALEILVGCVFKRFIGPHYGGGLRKGVFVIQELRAAICHVCDFFKMTHQKHTAKKPVQDDHFF
jgi:hypothetical protein